jgi:PAS domain S-box-containing protein
MSNRLLTDLMMFANATLLAVGLKSAILLALFSTWVVVLVFASLNLHTRQACFRFWAVAWLFFSMYLAASMGLVQRPDLAILVILGRACIGISALFTVWGGLHVTGRIRPDRELAVGSIVILTWSSAAPYIVPNQIWADLPAFLLLALASSFVAILHLKYWKSCTGARVLTISLLVWSLYLLAIPWGASLPVNVTTLGYCVSAAVPTAIAIGAIMLVLEQARERKHALLDDLKKGVTERRMLEGEISESEQKYRLLFDSAGDAIFLVDLATLEVLEANPAAAELAGCASEKLVKRSFLELCPKLRSRSARLLENKRFVEELFDEAGEFQMVRGQGEQVLCEGRATLMEYHKRPVFQVNAREISGRKRMEQQLRQAEKLSALGQLVAGVAHELNNPLAVVMGYAQLLTKQEALSEKVRKDLTKILHESERAAKIVRNLLTFARPREPHLLMVDVNALVAVALETREIQVQGANIKVVRRLASDLPATKADPDLIEQVLANLVTNAVQALESHPGQRVLEVSTERRGDAIRISVTDTGPGIPIQIVDRIFDPFFTTKGPGRGTGLGLSICYSIMEEHRGKIWAESQVGKGSRFIVELPMVKCADAVEERKSDVGPGEEEPGGPQRRLLIVDDEPGIVEVLKEALDSRGYHTETASNGAEALQRIESQDFDLIISDLCMPEMSGEKLFAVIGERFPHLQDRIVFVTGDTVSAASRRFLDQTGTGWLSKPFDISGIERLVKNHLRSASAETVQRMG